MLPNNMNKPKLRTYEIMIITGRRITGSFTVKASSLSEADKKSEDRRRKLGAVRYRIADASSGTRPRHGGVHQRYWDHRARHGQRIA